ncbi:MAG: succinate dehydrogenase assembly factor 2 [Paracoccaceae bacterium]
MPETPENRIKRLRMRSWRRGTKEMDMILGQYADSALTVISENTLNLYEALLHENDQDLYLWVSDQQKPPTEFSSMINIIRDFHKIQ